MSNKSNKSQEPSPASSNVLEDKLNAIQGGTLYAPSNIGNFQLNQEESEVVYDNTKTGIIHVRPDTLKVKLMELEQPNLAISIFLGSIGFIVSTILTLTTASSFNLTFGIQGTVWNAIFLLVFVVALIVAIISLCFWIYLKHFKKISKDRVIEDLKKSKEFSL